MLIIGRKIQEDGSVQYVGETLNNVSWDTYLKKFEDDAWKETIDEQQLT